MKIQHFYEYLISTGLITAEQVEVWESDSETYNSHQFDGSTELIKTRQYTINLLVNGMTLSQNRDAIEFAVLWWLNVYEDSHDLTKPRFRTEPDIQNHQITDFWLGFTVTEKSKLNADGTIDYCNRQNVITEEDLLIPTWLRFVDYEGLEFQLADDESGFTV